jgi:carbamoylphosphate synthase large subunit
LSIAPTSPQPPGSPGSIWASLARHWKTLRYRLGEVRTFGRFARRLRLASPDAPGCTVILYGIPYGDWNATLADPCLWQGLADVTEVRRVPAFGFLLPRASGRTIVIPMKTEHAAKVPRGCRGLLPDARALEVLDNKRHFAAYVAQNGLEGECPQTYADPDTAAFPCFAKRVDLSGSMGVEVAHTRDQLDMVLRSRLFAGKPYLLQAAVAHEIEYASTCLCDGGRILWHWTFAARMDGPLVVKNEENARERRTVDMPVGVKEQIERLLVPLAYRGPCVVNYKLDAGGRARIFEINPRFGGSLLQGSERERLREALACLLAASA